MMELRLDGGQVRQQPEDPAGTAQRRPTAGRPARQGAYGYLVLAREGDGRLRFEVATEHIAATDTTGAGDAFDAGFLVGWFTSRAAGKSLPA